MQQQQEEEVMGPALAPSSLLDTNSFFFVIGRSANF